MITKSIFAVMDNMVHSFGDPFHVVHEQDAVRAFTTAALDKQTYIGKFPREFELRRIGMFNVETGEITSHAPEFIISGIQVIRDSNNDFARQMGTVDDFLVGAAAEQSKVDKF